MHYCQSSFRRARVAARCFFCESTEAGLESTCRFTSSAAAQRCVAAPAAKCVKNCARRANWADQSRPLTFAQMMVESNPRDSRRAATRRVPKGGVFRLRAHRGIRHAHLLSMVTTSSVARALLRYSRATSTDTRVHNAPLSSLEAANESQPSKANAKRPDSPKTSLLRGGLVNRSAPTS